MLEHPKIEVIWDSVVEEAYGNAKGLLGGVKVKNVKTGGQGLRAQQGGCPRPQRGAPRDRRGALPCSSRHCSGSVDELPCVLHQLEGASHEHMTARADALPAWLAAGILLALSSAVKASSEPERGSHEGCPFHRHAGAITDVPLAGLFFAIGHEPATAFLDGQVGTASAGRAARGVCCCAPLLRWWPAGVMVPGWCDTAGGCGA